MEYIQRNGWKCENETLRGRLQIELTVEVNYNDFPKCSGSRGSLEGADVGSLNVAVIHWFHWSHPNHFIIAGSSTALTAVPMEYINQHTNHIFMDFYIITNIFSVYMCIYRK